MKKINSLLAFIFFISIIILLQSCKEEENNPVTPTERPVYEVSGTVGSDGAIIQVTDQNSPINGAFVDIPEGALDRDYVIKITHETNKQVFVDDTNAILIKLEPEGLIFEKTIEIGVPVKIGTNFTNLKAFYINPDNNTISEIPIKSIDQNNLIVKVETNHFSTFVVTDGSARITSTFYYYNNRISVRTYIDGFLGSSNLGLTGITTLLWSWPFGVFNAKQAIEDATFLLTGAAPQAVIRVSLKKKVNFWFDQTLEEKTLIFVRNELVNGILNGILYYDPQNNGNPSEVIKLYETLEQTPGEREEWYSGDPLIFHFNDLPNTVDEYYITVTWALTSDFTYNNTATAKYTIDTYEEAVKVSQMLTNDLDQNNNYIVDTYENSLNVPPAPTLLSPADGATIMSLPLTLSWNSSSGASYYSLQVSTSSSFTSFIFNDSVGYVTNKQIVGLNNTTQYYWRVNATNSYGISGWSTAWSFTTTGTAPTTPTLLLPTNGAPGLSTSPTLSWNASTGATGYTLQVSTNSSFSSFVYNQSGLTSTSQQVSELSNSTTYYWRVSASNNYGNSEWSSVWSFITELGGGSGEPCPEIPTVTYEGKTYNTVLIGDQCWLKENLDVGVMIQGNQNQTNNNTLEKFCYDNNSSNCNTYGGLYQWDEAMQYITSAQGICPPGWHIPFESEFQILATAVNNDGNSLKEIGQGTGDGTGINTSGFSGLLAGSFISDNYFFELGSKAYFWSCTSNLTAYAGNLRLDYDNSDINLYYNAKYQGFSIRCIKGEAGGNAPEPPTLLFPLDGSMDISVSSTLSWNASTGAASYTLQVSTNSSFSSFVYNQSGLTSTSQQVSELSNSTTYYWRVSATNTYGTSSWSSVWNFTTVSGGIPGEPCPGIPTVTYAGKTYNTVYILDKCWLKENLDVGTMIQGSQNQTNNSTIEKYCYNNDPSNCDVYGGLYQWEEAMQYSPAGSNVQGICPSAWRVPTLNEYSVLNIRFSGEQILEVGQGVGNNESGFSALLSGKQDDTGFLGLDSHTIFWSSNIAIVGGTTYGYLYYLFSDGSDGTNYKSIYWANSIRCIKN